MLDTDRALDFLIQRIKERDPRVLGRAISLVEEGGEAARALIKQLSPVIPKVHIIGITGSPGTGKSTFISALIKEIRQHKLKVAVLAVDPTSPLTGGALLGDRIRMQEHILDRGVYIRSLANRGHEGGLALSVYDSVKIIEAADFDVLVIETVGAGQSDFAITKVADTTLLLLMPGSGDEIQAIKSGIMEVADMFVVNKADLPDAKRTAAEVLESLELASAAIGWHPPVELVSSITGTGVAGVWEQIQNHKNYLENSGTGKNRRLSRLKTELTELVSSTSRAQAKDLLESGDVSDLLMQVMERRLDVHTAARALAGRLFGGK